MASLFFLSRDQWFCPPERTLGNGDIYGCHDWGVAGTEWVGARGAAQHPHSAQDGLPENGQPQMSAVPKLNPTLHHWFFTSKSLSRRVLRGEAQEIMCKVLCVHPFLWGEERVLRPLSSGVRLPGFKTDL